MTETLDRAERQLDGLGSELDPATAADLRLRIDEARRWLEILSLAGHGNPPAEIPPFWSGLPPE